MTAVGCAGRRAGWSAALLVAGLVAGLAAGCGGPGDAPRDASTGAFCAAWDRLALAESGEDLRQFAAAMREVGTPADIPDRARDGFVVVVREAAAVDPEGSVDDLTDGDVSESEVGAAEEFFGYARGTCGRPLVETP